MNEQKKEISCDIVTMIERQRIPITMEIEYPL